MSKPHFAYYDLILVAFVCLLLISNLSATKLVAIGPIITDGGAVLFPLIYIINDVLTEVYGYRHARRAIWAGFGVMVLAIAAFTVVRYLPPAAEYADQAAFETVLGFFPRIVIASLAAYMIGSLINALVLVKLKAATNGRHLWLRFIGLTVIGELLDTTIFALIAFGGILGGWDMLIFILIGWGFKTGVEILLLPLTYRAVAWLKHREGGASRRH